MRTVLRTGGVIDIPSIGEIRAEIAAGVGPELAALREETGAAVAGMADTLTRHMASITEIERERARAVKWLRFPRLRGTVTASAIKLGAANNLYIGPESGYLWSVRRLVISGLTASASAPDIVNFYYTDSTGSTSPIWWQLNGNSFGTEWDMGGMMMRGGECLNVVNVGSIAATGPVVVDWDGWEVPEDMAWKLIAGG